MGIYTNMAMKTGIYAKQLSRKRELILHNGQEKTQTIYKAMVMEAGINELNFCYIRYNFIYLLLNKLH